ncbi:cellulose biosynthesis protein BcsN [Neorhizobium sp. SOG26]|nr:cellulose biosynthesis protein BcsN [Neorhizobium sp. SOG26]
MADDHLIRIINPRGQGRTRARTLLALLLPVVAAGCAGNPTQLGTFAKTVPNEEARLLPPPSGPAIVSVIERRYNNAVAQDIYLATSAATPGQNSFKVEFFGTANPFLYGDNNLTSRPVTQSGIASEMRQALPGIRMQRSAFFVQNNYGPFGYAFGHGAGRDLCLYAWQQIRSPGGTVSPLANNGSIQVRLRLCQTDASEERLLAVMYNYTITGSVDSNTWNPYGEPKPVSSDLGGVGAPIYPRPSTGEPIVPVLPERRVVYTGAISAPPVQQVATQVSAGPRRQAAAPAPVPTTPAVTPVANSGVTVPRPGIQASNVAASTTTATQSGITNAPVSKPVIPSPSGFERSQRVTVPSPRCTGSMNTAASGC